MEVINERQVHIAKFLKRVRSEFLNWPVSKEIGVRVSICLIAVRMIELNESEILNHLTQKNNYFFTLCY